MIRDAALAPARFALRGLRRMRTHFVATQARIHPPDLSDDQLYRLAGYPSMDGLLGRKLPPFFFDPDDRDRLTELVRREYPASVVATVADADRVCDHVFDLLGSGPVRLPPDIDWNRDFKSGFRWDPTGYYLDGSYVDVYMRRGIHADVKVPWELSRCQHFPTLGKAYWYTGNEKYAREFANEIDSWIRNNPVGLGANWACTMDVAIRAVNWVWGYYFFCRSKSLDDELRKRLYKSLYLHGRHIMGHLEYGRIRGNHYLSDIVGLVYLGAFFPDSAEGRRWLEKGHSELISEMGFQVCADGVDFERSTCYQRLVTELFLSATLLGLRNGLAFPPEYMERLERMGEFILAYTRPDGTAPQIGDNDNGRLHMLSGYGRGAGNDHRYLLAALAATSGRTDFRGACQAFDEEAFWLTGPAGLERFRSVAGTPWLASSRAFTEGGFYVIAGGGSHMIIDAVPVDTKAPGGHLHNSRLSFELFSGGRALIVDPGTYTYTSDPAARNLFRGTACHNTIMIDGEEQNRLNPRSLFNVMPDAAVRVLRWEPSADGCLFDAEHYGYRRLKDPVTHRRTILHSRNDGCWIIKDRLAGSGKHLADLYFHPGVADATLDDQGRLTLGAWKDGAGLMVMPPAVGQLKAKLLDGWISGSYGLRQKAPVLRYSLTAELPIELTTIILERPGIDIADAGKISEGI